MTAKKAFDSYFTNKRGLTFTPALTLFVHAAHRVFTACVHGEGFAVADCVFEFAANDAFAVRSTRRGVNALDKSLTCSLCTVVLCKIR